MKTFTYIILVFIVTAVSISFAASFSENTADRPIEKSTKDQPLKGRTESFLGKVDFPISCSATVKSQFNKGLALLHHMMYGQAEKEFETVSKRAPDCAMAYWGIAMTLFHPLWAEPNDDELKKGSQAIKTAKALNPPTKREQEYIAAVEAFYKNWEKVDNTKRLGSWEAAQQKVYENNPNDIDAGAFYALSHLATAPKGDRNFTHQKKAGELLEKLRDRAPEHPGLFHYTIHAYDNPMFASRSLAVARDYHKIAPEVPHAQHMPSHIFVRMGLWQNTIEWNKRSADAAKKQSQSGVLSLHYIHALDYLMYAYLQRAQDRMAQDVLSKINGVEKYQDSFASAYGIAAAQARYPLERREWSEAMKLPFRTHSTFPWDKYPWYESITYFASGLGAARSGDTVAARSALEMLNTLYDRSVKAGQKYWAVHVKVQHETVNAWIAFSEGKKDTALRLMRQAADLEDSVDKHPVTPGAVLPARELFGDMLLLSGMYNEALDAYEASLKISPNRFNSLYGAGHAAELEGDLNKAKSYYSKVAQIATGEDSIRPRMRRTMIFLSKN
jgi:tetratricopeptide (TPR) repeat protein